MLEAAADGASAGDDGSNAVPIALGVGGAVGVGIGATIALRRRGAAAGDGQ